MCTADEECPPLDRMCYCRKKNHTEERKGEGGKKKPCTHTDAAQKISTERKSLSSVFNLKRNAYLSVYKVKVCVFMPEKRISLSSSRLSLILGRSCLFLVAYREENLMFGLKVNKD